MNLPLAFVATTLLVAGTVGSETITVTTVADAVDIDWPTATIEDLPGPDGLVSLSEAMIATNNTPGHQTVGFAIPADELGWCCPQYDGVAVFHSITGYFWSATDEVTIDGTTQTEFAGDTNPDGCEVLLYGENIGLNAPNSTLVGFHSTAIGVSGSNCLVEGNTGSTNISLFQAHGSVVRGNTGGTIKVDRSNDVVVVGNTVQRVRIWGFGASQLATNTRVGGPDPEDRNFITGYGTWNSEGLPAGETIQVFDTQGTIIENNWIGTTPDGMEQGSLASTMGIRLQGQNHDAVILNNRIAGILGHGQGPHHAGQLFGWALAIGGSGSGLTITGNTIGLDANDEPTLGSVVGVDIGDAWFSTLTDIQVGGTAPGEGNVIAGHIFNGVTVENNVAQARISGNAIYDNGWLGIDLIPSSYGYGVTPNDPLDADTGGNGLQNFPEIDSAVVQGNAIAVAGSLHSSPLDEFSIEFFASPACDGSGFGEGQLFIGSTSATTDSSGDASFDAVLMGAVEAGWFITATATLEPLGATSEFSACFAVESAASPADLDGDGDIDGADLGLLLGDWGPCDGCPADLDGDGVVGGADLGLLLGAWTG